MQSTVAGLDFGRVTFLFRLSGLFSIRGRRGFGKLCIFVLAVNFLDFWFDVSGLNIVIEATL